MLAARAAGLEGQFRGYQHSLQPMHRNGRQHVGRSGRRRVFEQVFLQPQQRIGHLGERGAVSQRAGLAVDQADVVPEVVEGLVTLEAPGIPCDFLAIGDELEGVG